MQLYTQSDFGQACKDKGGDKDDGDVLKEDEGRELVRVLAKLKWQNDVRGGPDPNSTLGSANYTTGNSALPLYNTVNANSLPSPVAQNISDLIENSPDGAQTWPQGSHRPY